MPKLHFSKLLVLGAFLLPVACGGRQRGASGGGDDWMMVELKKQASFDMNCAAADLNTIETGQYRYGVRGCGRQATYVMQACNRLSHACTYIMNSPVSDIPGGTPAAGTPSDSTPVAAAPGAEPEPAAQPAATP